MSTTQTQPKAAPTERFAATVQVLIPVAAGVLAPMLDPSAAAAAGLGFMAGATFAGANYMNRLGQWVDQLPGMDIARAHRDTMGISTMTTGMALGLGILGGPEATDLLMAGVLNPVSVPGILSLGWWSAVGLTGFKLRRVFGRRAAKTAHTAGTAAMNTSPAGPVTLADQIMLSWGAHISHADRGQHRHQILTDVTVYTDRWTGRIIAPAGASVNVSKDTVSSVYQRNPGWIDLEHGDHAGEALITVWHNAPAELDPATLQGAWKKRIARAGGIMPKTHLEQVTDDPNFDGQSAYVVADEDLDILKAPDRTELAGALRTSPLLVSYEPIAQNPRKAIIRMMRENPLEKGHAFGGLGSLKMTKGGRFPIGRIISGHPAMLPAFDPLMGGQHLVIAGTTGSGKGGAVQVVCLGYHANGAAIIYGDPKGSSNPAIPKMAAYSGVRQYGTLGAMRISYAVLMHRIDESERLELKNFKASKMRPWCATVMDEVGQVLGPNMPNRKEAVAIVKAGASLGRSVGMPWCLINQVVNLDQLGGEQAIRANLIKGGTWLILRTDSDQTNLADLPEGFEGIDPGAIPATWSQGDDPLVYDPEIPENDPIRTFGLGYLAAPGSRPGMMRIDILEDATPYIQTGQIAAPVDVPWWGDETVMEEIANTPLSGFEEKGDGDDGEGGGGSSVFAAGLDFQKKEPTAEEKILTALRNEADPLHLDYLNGADEIEPGDFDVVYMDRAALLAVTGLKESTFGNALTRLEGAGKIHRTAEGKNVRVGLGRPAQDDAAA